MTTLEDVVGELHRTLDTNQLDQLGDRRWRRRVLHGYTALRDLLLREPATAMVAGDGWLDARAGTTDRERMRLVARLSAFSPSLLDRLEPELMRRELRRLLTDVDHYVQRRHDLVYDSVALELGGSE